MRNLRNDGKTEIKRQGADSKFTNAEPMLDSSLKKKEAAAAELEMFGSLVGKKVLIKTLGKNEMISGTLAKNGSSFIMLEDAVSSGWCGNFKDSIIDRFEGKHETNAETAPEGIGSLMLNKSEIGRIADMESIDSG